MAAPAIDLTRINVGVVNRRALRKYAEFWAALQAVGAALEAAERLAIKASEQPKPARRHWSAASPEEMRKAAKKATHSLRVISTSAKRWEAELISRDCR